MHWKNSKLNTNVELENEVSNKKVTLYMKVSFVNTSLLHYRSIYIRLYVCILPVTKLSSFRLIVVILWNFFSV